MPTYWDINTAHETHPNRPEPEEPVVAAPAPALSDAVGPEVDAPTGAFDLNVAPGSEDDAYLAELRKAMTDESPLGPREEGDLDRSFDATVEQGRSRFGRRR